MIIYVVALFLSEKEMETLVKERIQIHHGILIPVDFNE
jgi:hypothetical protein